MSAFRRPMAAYTRLAKLEEISDEAWKGGNGCNESVTHYMTDIGNLRSADAYWSHVLAWPLRRVKARKRTRPSSHR
jgi:hypothetical protein